MPKESQLAARSREIRREKESVLRMLPSPELKNFIQRTIVPLLVGRYLENKGVQLEVADTQEPE